MKKKLIISVFVVLFVLTAVVTAGGINGDYQGFPIVNVLVNGEKVESQVPAINFKGSTLLPVRAIAEATKSLVEWDGNTWTANLVKPEVNMFFVDSIEESEDGSDVLVNPFKLASVGTPNAFYTYTSVDGLKEGICKYRVIVQDPKGDIVFNTNEYEFVVESDDAGGFVAYNYYDNLTFRQTGKYIFKFQIESKAIFETVHETNLIVY